MRQSLHHPTHDPRGSPKVFRFAASLRPARLADDEEGRFKADDSETILQKLAYCGIFLVGESE